MFMDSLQYKALSLCLKKRLLVFLFSSLVFLLRMRSVGKSRFQLSELVAGEPRPKARRVLIETPFRLEPLPCITDAPAQLPAPHARPACAGVAAIAGQGSLRAQTDEAQLVAARLWTKMAEDIREDSSVLRSIPQISGENLCFLFLDRAAPTLQKHLAGWKQWLEFARLSGFGPARPSPANVRDFAQALAAGAAADRGRSRRAKAEGVFKALKFASHKLGLEAVQYAVDSPAVTAWMASSKWSKPTCKEAIPLPLFVVARLEVACGQSHEDFWLIGCILLMIWGGLRWSDAQRLQFSSLEWQGDSLRGWTWRTKTCASGLPFGLLTRGVTNSGWGEKFAKALIVSNREQPLRDFLVAKNGVPMTYATMLAQLRRCLVEHILLSQEEATQFTLHSLKTTTLSWALQLGISIDLRAAQGHHKLPSASVQKYGRDDIWPQLACQKKILQAIARNWRPQTPLNRGLQSLPEIAEVNALLCLRADDITDSESEGELPDAAELHDASQSDVECADSDDESVSEPEPREFAGPWLLNTKTGWSHRAVQTQGGCWGLACRPSATLCEWYILRESDPELVGYQPCSHSGCFPTR